MSAHLEVGVVDGGWRSTADADHAAHLLAPRLVPGTTVATHVLRRDQGRVVSLALPAAQADVVRAVLPSARVLVGVREGPAAEVATAHAARSSGRLVCFPGEPALRGPVTAAGIVADSEVDAVVGLAGAVVDPHSIVDLGDFVRPTWRGGECRLVVQHGARGLIPFEVRDQIACCADH